ncbi:uncharacterized protein B0T15DRAFT_513758 [Chaetomium strumarium]|uniref:DNA-binding protein RAP1 n=1 Tax=Chaetomium strumarium TaxID=1170767 RepID=A0AAJ0LZP1_9PEZI|nr:hypothetical protein B0T15DRAFT_513758 [Chaetomium strumarium]
MPTTVVYEGVNGKYEGTLFNGVKFWDNGGKIVLLEKHADVLIADHAKKTLAPAGSVSWKYVEDSVAKGELANIDDYRIHDVEGKRPAKGTKVPFSEEDDRILVTWVRQKEKAGDYLAGNKIYQELEKLVRSSYKLLELWVKRLAFVREEALPTQLPELPLSRSPPFSAEKGEPVNLEHSKTPNAEVTTPPNGIRAKFTKEDEQILITWVRQKQRVGEKLSGNKIYKELEQLHPQHGWQSWRDKWVKQMAFLPEEGLPAPPPDVQRLPTVTPASTSRTTPSVITAAAGAGAGPSTRPASTATPPGKSTTQPYRDPGAAGNPQTPPIKPISRSKVVSEPHSSPKSSGPRPSRLQELARRRKLVQAARTVQRVWRGYAVRRDIRQASEYIRAFQAIAQGYVTRRVLEGEETTCFDTTEPVVVEDNPPTPVPDRDPEPLRPPDVPSPNPRPPVQTKFPTQKEDFWRYFNAFNEVTGAAPAPWVQIGRRTVDLWDLWRGATAQPHHGSRDWQEICEELGIDWVAQPDAPVQVKGAFEQYLLEFENAVGEFEQLSWEDTEDGTTSQNGGTGEQATEGDQDGQEMNVDTEEEPVQESGNRQRDQRTDEEGGVKETVSQLSDDIPSSVPVFGLKRSFGLSASSFLSSASKRLRYDPSSEIPCTPEARSGRAGQGPAGARAAVTVQETPTRRGRPRPPAESGGHSLPSPSGLDGANDDEELLTPSHQLLSEDDAGPPAKGISRDDRGIAWTKQPLLPSVESEDKSTDSSDAFESILPTRAQPPKENPRRRTLPRSWSTSKGKAPAGPSSAPAASPPPRPPISSRQIVPLSSHSGAPTTIFVFDSPERRHTLAVAAPPKPPTAMTEIRSSSHAGATAAATIPFSAPPGMRTVIDPLPTIRHFISKGYPPQDVALAAKLTTAHKSKMRAVLDSVAQGHGIPWSMAGVWTAEEDDLLRGIGQWVDRMGLVVPRKEDRACFGNDDGRRAVFWRLAGKHGGFAVLERWPYLRAWDQS